MACPFRANAPKPPMILVYTADQEILYEPIRKSLSAMLCPDIYTISYLSHEDLKKPAWVDPTSACLMLVGTEHLDDRATDRIREYLRHFGKIFTLCHGELISTLTCGNEDKSTLPSLLRLAFADQPEGLFSLELCSFFKRASELLDMDMEVCEQFKHTGDGSSIFVQRKIDGPLFLRRESPSRGTFAFFSDASNFELLEHDGHLLKEAMEAYGMKISTARVLSDDVTGGCFIIDELFLDENQGKLHYGKELGSTLPRLFLRSPDLAAESSQQLPPKATEDLLPIQVLRRTDLGGGCPNLACCRGFDAGRYFGQLSTLRTGRNVLYIPVATTTMDISQSLSNVFPGAGGLVVIARQQTKGQGRDGNEWISPVGQACFSFNYILTKQTALANSAFIQHVVALSVVKAAHELSGLADFPLRIKWPNDFYHGRDKKLGGQLVRAHSYADYVEFTIGVGINVSNSLPTTCLNDLLVGRGGALEFHVQELIAATLTHFEKLVNLYENEGQKKFLEAYYPYWLHKGEEVIIEDDREKVIIPGLDADGYLQVRSKADPQKVYSVMEDRNKFDMMSGLIRTKTGRE